MSKTNIYKLTRKTNDCYKLYAESMRAMIKYPTQDYAGKNQNPGVTGTDQRTVLPIITGVLCQATVTGTICQSDRIYNHSHIYQSSIGKNYTGLYPR